MSILPVFASSDARNELPKALKRFRAQGASADPVVFGSHRKPEAVVIPFALYSQLLPMIEDLEIAALVRERAAAGEAAPLSDIAAGLGLDPSEYE